MDFVKHIPALKLADTLVEFKFIRISFWMELLCTRVLNVVDPCRLERNKIGRN